MQTLLNSGLIVAKFLKKFFNDELDVKRSTTVQYFFGMIKLFFSQVISGVSKMRQMSKWPQLFS